jgi:predicted enzyme related to lactoylglutathione lyase
MPVRLHHIVIDARDLPLLARFWAQALGWQILSEREHEIVIGADDNAPVGICFMPLGAHPVEIGQTGAESWTVLADPEGNEFCVVRPKETLTR